MWRKRKLFRESNLIICRFHCAWLAVDSFISAANLWGGNRGSGPPPPLDLLSQIHLSLWSVDGFAFFRLSCFDHSDLQLFALFIFDVDFSKTYLKTSAENSVSEPPTLKIFSPRSLYKVRAFSTRDNVLPLQKPSHGPDSGVSWWSCHKNIVYKHKNAS